MSGGSQAVRVVLLGRLADRAGGEIAVPIAAAEALPTFLARLPAWLRDELAGGRIRIAVNGVLVAPNEAQVSPGDELALLPPVSGG